MMEMPEQNPYGYVDLENKEFVITRPDTPTPWMNYIGEGRYGGIISNTAGGYAFDRDPRNRRVSRYRYNAIPVDQPGRYIYIRDQDSGKYWSPTWQPVTQQKLENYECRHGTAYTRIKGSYADIATDVLYFVPPTPLDEQCPCEIWLLTLRNDGDTPRALRTFSYVEFSFYDANIDQTNLDWGMHIFSSNFNNGIIRTHTSFNPAVTYFSSNREPVGFDSDREVFIGPYRDLGNPVVVETGESQNIAAARGNNIGSLSHEIILAPGETQQLIYIMGVTDAPELIENTVAKYQQVKAVDSAFHALREDWDAYLATYQVNTPDEQTNAMINLWHAIQCRTTLYWSRFISAYDTGLGRGMGTRDSAQDTLATVQALPAAARKTLTMLWKLQFIDGHTWHQVFPLTGEGGPGLAEEIPDWPQWFSDDHLWLIMATLAYLRETGDFDFINECIEYQDAPAETIWQHIERGIQFTMANRGPHGLPRHGFSDWNDTMNIDHGSGLAESIMTAELFCRATLDLVNFCTHWNHQNQADYYADLHSDMATAINEHAWDGAWFLRAFDDDGAPVGSSVSEFQRIALNSQTWAVIGEVTPQNNGRLQTAMHSAHEHLNTPLGLRVMTPPYTRYIADIQGTTTMPPGAKENGSVFCHANTWAIVAAAKLGWGDRAFQYYKQYLPLRRTDADRYKAEPYVYCQAVCAPEHPQYGLGRNSWLTGTAAWTYVGVTQWILGIRPTFEGLQIAPVLPEDWKITTVKRTFRGTQYEITMERVGPGNAVKLCVNGESLAGNIIPLPKAAGGIINVNAKLGTGA